MVIVRINGGLGNQMFQYAMAKSFAKNRNDIFKMDISFYPKQTLRKYELNLFYVKEDIAADKENIMLRGQEGLYYKIRKKLNIPLKRPSTYIRETLNFNIEKEVSYPKENIYLDGIWQNEKYFFNIRKELISDFTPKIHLGTEAKSYIEEIQKKNSISLHVRRGDYIANDHTKSFHGVCNIEYYKKAIEYIVSNVPQPKFYIFSDDMQWCKKNFSFLENKVYVDKTANAIEDLELMKNCKHNIIANSTFSWWGAWLNNFNNKIVITPKIWWEAKPKQHIAPEKWIKL